LSVAFHESAKKVGNISAIRATIFFMISLTRINILNENLAKAKRSNE